MIASMSFVLTWKTTLLVKKRKTSEYFSEHSELLCSTVDTWYSTSTTKIPLQWRGSVAKGKLIHNVDSQPQISKLDSGNIFRWCLNLGISVYSPVWFTPPWCFSTKPPIHMKKTKVLLKFCWYWQKVNETMKEKVVKHTILTTFWKL